MRYIELNPVRAGMVKHPLDYSWSSYAANARGEENALVSLHSLYRRLGRNPQARQSAYRQLFRAALGKGELDAIREATNTGWVLGNDCLSREDRAIIRAAHDTETKRQAAKGGQ